MSGSDVFEVNVRCPNEARDLASAMMFEAGCQGLEELDCGETGCSIPPLQYRTFFEGKIQAVEFRERLLEALKKLNVSCQVTVRSYQSRWQSEWLKQLGPVELDPCLILVPVTGAQTSVAEAVPSTELWLEHAMAFGFGEHPTTRLAARWLLANAGGRRVLDFGTGTGVLALVAARSGAVHSVGVDIDAQSIEVARRNAARNGLSEACSFHVGTEGVRAGQFDLIVANIDAATLISLAPDLLKYSGGTGAQIALTGLLEEQVDDVRDGFKPFDVQLERGGSAEDWVLLSASI